MATQTDELLGLLRNRPEGITPIDALYLIGCFRLAARIHDLRAEGYDIDGRLVTVAVRNGRKVRVARYRLVAA